jgi:outer membrane lipoprotein-sorting protein
MRLRKLALRPWYSRTRLRRCAIFAALAAGAFLLQPRGITTAGKQSKQAEAIVRLLEARYHSASTWRATFLERYSEGPRDIRLESGTAYFRRPGRMRWEYEAPEKKLFIADGRTVWFYVPADKTVTRAAMKESDDWRTPLSLLTGRVRLDRLCGRVELLQPPALEKGSTAAALANLRPATLRCLPREEQRAKPDGRGPQVPGTAIDARAPFEEILLQVNRETGDLDDVVIRQAGGVEMEYRFGNWQKEPPLSDAMFRFQAPPGVAIVEEPADASARR